MESPIQVPKELESLLSCGLCRRPYDLASGLLPRELVCQHSFCDGCVASSTVANSAECICSLCGVSTHLSGQKLSETVAIVYLLRELPALVLGRAMLDFTKRNGGGISIEESTGEESSAEEPNSENWLDEICVDRFLASSAEHCFIHAMPNSTWCQNCQRLLCRACSDVPMHQEHRLIRQLDYQDLLHQLLCSELAKMKSTAIQTTELAAREMDLFRDLSEACFQVQLHVKRVMLEHQPSMVAAMMTGWQRRAELDLSRAAGNLTGADMMQLLAQLAKQRRRFEGQLVEVHFHCRMRAAVQENGMQVLDFDHLNDRILQLRSNPRPGAIPPNVEPPRALILTNYCVFAYWNEVQRQLIPPRSRTPPIETELLPQSRRAVVPPHFTHYQREIEARVYMEQVERDQNQALNRLADDGSHGSSSSPSSSSNSSSAFHGNSTEPQEQRQITYVLDMDHYRMVQQYREMEWQAQQQRWQMQQEQQQPYLQAPSYQLFQPDASWVNWEEQWQRHQQQQQQQNQDLHYQDGASSSPVSIVRQPSVHCYPIYFLDMEIAGELAGRVLIEVRSDAAPRMADNFGALVRHDRGYGYRGCSVFQAWGGESIITGDFESHNGRGGHSAFDNRYFLPDDTGLPAHRGSVGMRRGQRRQDRSGFVGSQFRLVLNEMRSFTAIFGFIIQGIELVDRIAASGNALGSPALRSIIRNCGEYHANR
ncbi:hypothetical protein KR084_000920 [Drosophila pseudotakahashii]|nr:hypothetical protein KR084_000920 [Drosophila pseudotakahashii]